MIVIDLTNKKFGRLTVINYAYSQNGRKYWHCQCNCGNIRDIIGKDLQNGKIKSCGCLRKEESKKRMTKHGMTDTRLYHIWTSMKKRCINPCSEKDKKNYLLKGIKIYNEWLKFENFKNWALENGYTDKLTIDRINNNGNYCPENCRWVDIKTQENNKSNNRLLTYNGKTQTISQWADEIGMKYNTLEERIRKGWSVEKAISIPVKKVGGVIMG